MAVFRATYATDSGSLSINLSAADSAAADVVANSFLSGPDSRPLITLENVDGSPLASVNTADVDSVEIVPLGNDAYPDAVHLEDDRIRVGLTDSGE